MTTTGWVNFDRTNPESFPSEDRDLIVQTARGQTFPARFIPKICDFSLKWSLWGNQGAVVRWRYADNHDPKRNSAPQFADQLQGTP